MTLQTLLGNDLENIFEINLEWTILKNNSIEMNNNELSAIYCFE